MNVSVTDYGAEKLIHKAGGLEADVSGYTIYGAYGEFANVAVGDTLWIVSGLNIGMYPITACTTDSATIGAPLEDATVRWKVSAGTPFDCTDAFQSAIDAASTSGGGTVYVPQGYFYFAYPLLLNQNAVLTGMWNFPAQWQEDFWLLGADQGPVLCPTSGFWSEFGTPFITMGGGGRNAGIEGLSIYYPLQGIQGNSGTADVAMVPYPYCIDIESTLGGSNNLHRIQNVQLVNPYQGIRADLGWGGASHIIGVFGCPLYKGIFLNHFTDVAYIEKIKFQPDNYVGAFNEDSPRGIFANDVRTFTLKNLTAIEIQHTDWIIVKDVSGWMMNKGLVFASSETGHPVLEMENIIFDICNFPISSEAAAGSNIKIFNLRLTTVGKESDLDIVNSSSLFDPNRTGVHVSGGGELMLCGGTLGCNGPSGIYWDSTGTLDVSQMEIFDTPGVVTGNRYGVHAQNGRVMVHGSSFGNNAGGFTEAVHITSGAARSIVYGNDYQTAPQGSNLATDRDFAVVGSVSVEEGLSVGGRITLNGIDLISGYGTPSSSPGVPAPIGSRFFPTGSAATWVKYGTGNMEWYV